MHFKLEWKTIGLTTLENVKASVNVLLKKYEAEFSRSREAMKHFRAKLNVMKDVRSIFLKPRSVPFAAIGGKNRKWLEAKRIVEKVTLSKWAVKPSKCTFFQDSGVLWTQDHQ